MNTTPWTDVPLFWLDSRRALTDKERVKALDEYRSTGGMYLVVMSEPRDGSPGEAERLASEGPAVDEIDWRGFPALCVAPEGKTTCRAPATTERTVEDLACALCAEHAAEIDGDAAS